MEKDLFELKEQLNRIESYTLLSSKTVLTMDEAVLFTGLSKARLYTLTSQKAIPHYKQGKIYFKRSELENWMLANRVPTNREIESKAVLHCNEHPQARI